MLIGPAVPGVRRPAGAPREASMPRVARIPRTRSAPSDMTEQAMDWQELTNLTRGRAFVVERVRLADRGIAIEGEFEPPQLAQLNIEDQVFVTAFVRCHGSIKEMERIFGVSYPTVKARLNRIAQVLDFVETDPTPSRAEVVDRLRRGEITAQQALSDLEGRP